MTCEHKERRSSDTLTVALSQYCTHLSTHTYARTYVCVHTRTQNELLQPGYKQLSNYDSLQCVFVWSLRTARAAGVATVEILLTSCTYVCHLDRPCVSQSPSQSDAKSVEHTHICTYVRTYIRTHTHICTYVCTHIHTYVHTHICMYVCTYIHAVYYTMSHLAACRELINPWMV